MVGAIGIAGTTGGEGGTAGTIPEAGMTFDEVVSSRASPVTFGCSGRVAFRGESPRPA
jgi:hypothetical protein